MRPFTIKHIDHLVLRVSDLPRSVAFYTELLGCTVSRVREDLGMVHLATGTAMIDLVTWMARWGSQAELHRAWKGATCTISACASSRLTSRVDGLSGSRRGKGGACREALWCRRRGAFALLLRPGW